MLRVASELNVNNRFSDSIIRHKVRNLRAKVRSLLPVHVCGKYNDRNKRVNKIQTKYKQSNCQCKGWNISQNSDTNWFSEPNQSQNQRHMFSKLTPVEIQQIKEDKIYYLGQDNIQLFQHYIDTQSTIRRCLKTSINYRSNAYPSTSNLQKNQPPIKSNNNCISFEVIDYHSQKPKKDKIQDNDSKMELENRKREIIQQLEVRKAKIRINSRLKMEKVENNAQQIKVASKLKLLKQSEQYQRKREKIKILKVVESQKGQLIDLTERLRYICLTRKCIPKINDEQN